ncbi:MAG: hypothetical protein KIS62_01195 [Ramlibacter sp.]|nr:hypothetical protein [Ramlibacter sp.]
MTKPQKARARADEWTFDMPAGMVTHLPTGLQFRMEPLPAGALGPGRADALESAGYTSAGKCWLPATTPDRREATRIAPGDANAPGVHEWAILAKTEALQAALDVLAMKHGATDAARMLPALSSRAGDGWIFRARLERGWINGARAT